VVLHDYALYKSTFTLLYLLHLFSDKTAEVTLEVDRCHWRRHNSMGHRLLSIGGLP